MTVPPDSPRGRLTRAFTSNRDDARDALVAISELREDLDRQEQQLVFSMRLRGDTWQEIADVFGISRQAAHERFEGARILDKVRNLRSDTAPPK